MWKTNFEESKQRYVEWWNHKGVVLSMWEHLDKDGAPHAVVEAPPPAKDWNQFWFDPEWRSAYLHYRMSRYSYKADILPVANTQLGPGSLAAALGAVLEGREDTIWIREDTRFDENILLDEQNPYYRLHLDLLKACRALSCGHYLVGCPDLMEGLDVLAGLKGSDRVLMDMMLEPERTLTQLQAVNDAWFQLFDAIYSIINDEAGAMAFCYFSLWGPGRTAKLQCDISTMISTDDFRTFALPFLTEQCSRIDYSLYHLDGVDAIRHLDALLEIERLDAIQWTPGYGQPQGGDPVWYDLYRKILAGGKSVMINWVQPAELKPLLDNIGNQGLHINVDFHSEQEIEEALQIVEQYR
jgi:hypothetical protein